MIATQILFTVVMAAVTWGICGTTWAANFGPPPPEVEALAFMLQGETVQ